MSKTLDWVKKNKLLAFLILIVLYFLFKNFFFSLYGVTQYSEKSSFNLPSATDSSAPLGLSRNDSIMPEPYNPPPPTDVKDRMVVKTSSLSILTKNVSQSLDSIKKYAESIDGYMTQSSLSNPQDAASADIAIRVPGEKLEDTLSFIRQSGIKVVSENLSGYDVTDEYVDNESRLATLEENKQRFDEMMKKATSIDDILKIQQQIFSLQAQIDQIKGQQKYLSETSKTVLISVFLSTDEFSLPYSPQQPWRPEVVFKTAVRSLITTFHKLGSLIIWLAVYSVILLPVIILFVYIKKRKAKKFTPPPSTN